MTGRQAVRLAAQLDARVVVPVYYKGRSHFVQGRAAVERELARAPDDVQRRFRWLPLGKPIKVASVHR